MHHAPHLNHARTLTAALAAAALAVMSIAVPARLADHPLAFGSGPGVTSAPVLAPTARPAWLDRPLLSPLRALSTARRR